MGKNLGTLTDDYCSHVRDNLIGRDETLGDLVAEWANVSVSNVLISADGHVSTGDGWRDADDVAALVAWIEQGH